MFALLTAEATTTVTSAPHVSFDSTITISIILALCALFAPSITARINNKHQYKMRKLELDYDFKKHQLDILYKDKYDAFIEFLNAVSEYNYDDVYNEVARRDILTHIHKVKLQCNSDTLKELEDFQNLVDNKLSCYSGHELETPLTQIANAFNKELTDLLVEPNNK